MREPGGSVTPAGAFEGYELTVMLDGSYYQRQNDIGIVHVKGWGGNPLGPTLLVLRPGAGFVQSVVPGMHKARYLPSEDWALYCNAMGKPLVPEAVVTVGSLLDDMIGFRGEVDNVTLGGFDWSPWHDCS